ncbi:hypothetical protein TNCV_2861481 [Trichonephila clavipes]|nr:hypothetical protein TNCV_2861481 [Trichonephila clavipes]
MFRLLSIGLLRTGFTDIDCLDWLRWCIDKRNCRFRATGLAKLDFRYSEGPGRSTDAKQKLFGQQKLQMMRSRF